MPDETLIDLLSRYPDPPPEPVDRPLPWAGALESSVFDPTWERDAKRALGLLVPTTPREVATELLMGAAAGPIGAAVSKVGGPVVRAIRRVVNPPFDPTKRQSLGSMLGKDTLENIQRREVSDQYIRGGTNKEFQRAAPIWNRAMETYSYRRGILGDIIEHGNVLSRKIREEALEEAGEVIKEEAPGEEIAKVVDAILRRWGIRGDR